MRPTILGSTVTTSAIGIGCGGSAGHLTAVITAARQQGSVDQEAEDLLHQAEDLANALQENPKNKDDGRRRTRRGQRQGQGRGQEAGGARAQGR